MTVSFTVLPNPDEVAVAAAEAFVEAARRAAAARGRSYVALPGGRTPLPAFQLLAEPAYRDRVPWELVELFWADERAVGPDDPESNYRAAYDAWLRHVPEVRSHRVHRMMAEAVDLDTAARHYEGELRRTVPANEDGIPVFDLIWLGMGADGHTASLCPNDAALAVTDRLVFATWPAGYPTERLTLTYPVLNAAREVVFAVTGVDKAETVAAVRAGANLPAARVNAANTRWFLDAPAAGESPRQSAEEATGHPASRTA